MTNRPRDLELKLNQDCVFLRLDAARLYSKRNVLRADRHSHAEYELHIVLQGVAQMDVEDRHYSLKEQQALLIAPGRYHLPQALPGSFERFSLSFSISEGPLLDCLRRQIPSCRVFSVTPEIEAICRTILNECGSKPPFWQTHQPALLSSLFIHLLRVLRLDNSPQLIHPNSNESVRTELIDDYFEHHFTQKAGLSELAEKLHLSKRQVARVLLESYGMGFQEKLTSTRMDHAAWLLRTTDQRISSIAGSVGYVSEAAFYLAFKNHFQVTPQEYRKQFLRHPTKTKN